MNIDDMDQTILVVDDDPHIRQLLVFALAKAGYQTVEAENGAEALEVIASDQPDLMILDITMPTMDGLEVCRRVRAQGNLPILFLSSRDDEIDRILGIELGGDDYVVKPFSPREVVARVGGILRRVVTKAPAFTLPEPKNAAGKPISNPVVQRGGVRLDTFSWSVYWQDRQVPVTATEFALLRTLMQAPSRVFSRDQLIDRLHGPGFAVSDRTIDSHVRNVRRKFAEVGCPNLIETRPAIGYAIGSCDSAPS
jgi:two-component system, OmpR family, response regulator